MKGLVGLGHKPDRASQFSPSKKTSCEARTILSRKHRVTWMTARLTRRPAEKRLLFSVENKVGRKLERKKKNLRIKMPSY